MKRALVRNLVAWTPADGGLAGAPEVRFLPPIRGLDASRPSDQ